MKANFGILHPLEFNSKIGKRDRGKAYEGRALTDLQLALGGVTMDADLNRYDTFHVVTAHERMSRSEWEQTYWAAWRTYYTYAHMCTLMCRAAARLFGLYFASWGGQITVLLKAYPGEWPESIKPQVTVR